MLALFSVSIITEPQIKYPKHQTNPLVTQCPSSHQPATPRAACYQLPDTRYPEDSSWMVSPTRTPGGSGLRVELLVIDDDDDAVA
jgi:hypothetical protein